MERDAALQILRQIAECDASAVERERAAVALLELGAQFVSDAPAHADEPPVKYEIEQDSAIQNAERFLLAQKLDRLCERYLLESGDKTFLDSRAGLNGRWVNAEVQRSADRAALERKLTRLRAMRGAALRVRDCWFSVLHDRDSEVDPAICVLLGVVVGADAGEMLSKAQTAYIALAAEGRTGDE